MNAQRVVADTRNEAAVLMEAMEEVAARMDEIQALGGASAFDAYFAGDGSTLDISAAQFTNLLTTLDLFRTVIRGSGTANFTTGHHTNLYTAKP